VARLPHLAAGPEPSPVKLISGTRVSFRGGWLLAGMILSRRMIDLG